MLFNPAIETLPLPKLRKLQNERLRNLVNYVYDRVPFYRQQFDEVGLQPSQIKGIDDLPLLPFTNKQDLRNNYPFGLLAVPRAEISRIHCSSGTTGKPTVVGYTAGDIDIFSEVVARSLAAGGCKPGMMLQNGYGYGLFTGGLGLHYGAEKLGMTIVPVSGGMTERQLMLLQDFKPDVLCCTPSYAQTLAEELQKREIPLESLNLRYALLGAEPWTETIRQHVQNGLGLQATNIYGLSEIIGPGVSQEDVEEPGSGSYVWEDHFYPEIVDKDTGEVLPEGELGVLVLTTLTKRGMPLIRYRTNDITNLFYDQCGKRTHIKMGPIKGRADGMLIIRGVNLFYTQVEEVLQMFEHLTPHYQLIVSREGTMDEVEVHVEVSEKLLRALDLQHISIVELCRFPVLSELSATFGKRLKENTGLTMKVTLKVTGEIPRSEGGKLNRVVDNRQVYA
ncbi:phenylacetate--CoA ligase [Pontibacter qinzhouensis]|uniref:Phenylacetate-coenzyme A ligase n=1 Tax=Pontibacter qinzhouensis TaxID=2603253 RepID=A0A5C8IKY1_9BACT|nr:phenylacetate--CoA ligase [Pontibacter qinzhouensis]TXK21636.1 phenylacetate--CoA ligase [Pontibacter qinzhouensis]